MVLFFLLLSDALHGAAEEGIEEGPGGADYLCLVLVGLKLKQQMIISFFLTKIPKRR